MNDNKKYIVVIVILLLIISALVIALLNAKFGGGEMGEIAIDCMEGNQKACDLYYAKKDLQTMLDAVEIQQTQVDMYEADYLGDKKSVVTPTTSNP